MRSLVVLEMAIERSLRTDLADAAISSWTPIVVSMALRIAGASGPPGRANIDHLVDLLTGYPVDLSAPKPTDVTTWFTEAACARVGVLENRGPGPATMGPPRSGEPACSWMRLRRGVRYKPQEVGPGRLGGGGSGQPTAPRWLPGCDRS